MTILVFGRTGQVATELQTLGGPLVTALRRDQADLTDPQACAAAIRDTNPTVVINAAAWTAVDKAESEEAAAQVVNGDAPAAMAAACDELGIPLVHISTDYVFDGSGTTAFKPDDP
ncbi:MAG: sugar nucleotide-binding protein, partial [Pseudomonadota bacterium]|nr:sugar nucleotide-binding protein [Pseudomonadota bacterium]